jgi:hypothetical protein
MAATPGTFDYFRRGGIYPNGNTKTALDYFRRGEPIVTMGADTVVGGAVLGGTAFVCRAYFPSGRAVLGGTAPVVFTKTYTPSSGFVAGGTAPVVFAKTYLASGGMVLGGTAPASLSSTIFTYLASGGMLLDGTADADLVDALVFYSYTMHWYVLPEEEGGSFTSAFQTVASSSAVVSPFWQYVGSGCIETDGEFNIVSSQWTYTGHWYNILAVHPVKVFESAFQFTDTGASYYPTTLAFQYDANPGDTESSLTLGGTSQAAPSYWQYVANHGMVVSRLRFRETTADTAYFLWYYFASGNSKPAGTSDQRVNRVIPATTARMQASSTGSPLLYFSYLSSGGIASGSSAPMFYAPTYQADGGMVTAGATQILVDRYTYVPAGKITTGNSAQQKRDYVVSGTGATFGGSAWAACSYYGYVAVPASLGLYAPSYYELIDHQKPIGFWIKSDTEASTLTNYGTAGTGGDATLSGSPVFQQPNWIPNNKDGYSMRFDWINTVAVVSGTEFTDAGPYRSISMVFRVNDLKARSVLYEEGNSLNGLNLSVTHEGNLVFHAWNISPPVFDSTSLSVPVTLDRTHHVAAVADGNANQMRLYLNGALVGSIAMFSAPGPIPARDSFAFGAKYNGTRYNDTNSGFAGSTSSPGTGHWLRGFVQAVAVWDRVLSSTEISMQQTAMAARYASSVDGVFTPLVGGNLALSGAADNPQETSSHWTYTAGAAIVTDGGSTTTSPVFSYAAGGGMGLSGTSAAIAFTTLWVYTASSGMVLSGTTAANIFKWAYVPSGGAVVGSQALGITKYQIATGGTLQTSIGPSFAASSYYSYVASGLLGTFVNGDIGQPILSGFPGGGMVLDAAEPAVIQYAMVYYAEGAAYLAPFARFDYMLEVSRDITWNISRGVLRYYRIEGKKPYSCPPVGGGTACGPDNCVQWIMNVSAHSVEDVCTQLRKLRFKGPIKRLSVFSRPVLKTDEDPNIDYTCNQLVDVTLPICDDLFLDYDLVVTAGGTPYMIQTQDFAYFPSGKISASGTSGTVFSNWGYVAGGTAKAQGADTDVYYPGLVLYTGSGGTRLFGSATVTCTSLGTLVATAGATAQTLQTSVVFGAQESGTLALPGDTISSVCCGELPSLLYMNHELNRFNKLDKFLFINGLSIGRNLRLVYSAKKNTWYNNLHFRGIGSSNDPETWTLTTEFGCVDDLDGIPIQGTLLWGFSFTMIQKNLRTKADNYTRVVLGFDPIVMCTLDRALDNTFTINVRNESTVPVALRAIVLYDEIGLFKNRSFIVNPNITFRVTSTPLNQPSNNINITNSLQELLL